MKLTKTQSFDRREWLMKLKKQVDQKKVVNTQLKTGGASLHDILSFLGKTYAAKAEKDGTIRIAKVAAPVKA